MKVISKAYWLLSLVLLTLMGGCTSEEGMQPTLPEEETFTLCFTLITTDRAVTQSSNKPSTRFSTSDYTYELGTENENKIDLANRDYRFYVFDAAGMSEKWIYSTGAVTEIKPIEGTGYSKYSVKMRVPRRYLTLYEDGGEAQLSIAMAANWRANGVAYPESTTLSNIVNTRFDSPLSQWLPFENGAGGIPMFGYLSGQIIDLVKASEDEFTLTNDLYLLRAVSKIEVIDRIGQSEQPTGKLYISDVELINANSEGTLGPVLTYSNGKVESVSYPETPNIPVATELTTRTFITKDASSENVRTWRLYSTDHDMRTLPLYTETNASKRPTLRVTVSGFHTLYAPGTDLTGINDSKYYYIHFADYDKTNGRPDTPNAWQYLLRNNIYRFQINRIVSDLDFTVDVYPYTEVWLNPDFGLGDKYEPGEEPEED